MKNTTEKIDKQIWNALQPGDIIFSTKDCFKVISNKPNSRRKENANTVTMELVCRDGSPMQLSRPFDTWNYHDYKFRKINLHEPLAESMTSAADHVPTESNLKEDAAVTEKHYMTDLLKQAGIMEVNKTLEDYCMAESDQKFTASLPEIAPVDKGIKHDENKVRMDLLDPTALNELSEVLTFGAKKYGANNWRKGISYGRLTAAALRHIFAFMAGKDYDDETGLPHIAHAMCCLMFILGQKQTTSIDDRYKK